MSNPLRVLTQTAKQVVQTITIWKRLRTTAAALLPLPPNALPRCTIVFEGRKVCQHRPANPKGRIRGDQDPRRRLVCKHGRCALSRKFATLFLSLKTESYPVHQ